MDFDSKLFVEKIYLLRDKISNFEKYPFNIEIIKNLDEVKFNASVTFLVGENGVGKSTLIEAIAVAIGLNPEGDSLNFNFNTKDTHSPILISYLKGEILDLNDNFKKVNYKDTDI